MGHRILGRQPLGHDQNVQFQAKQVNVIEVWLASTLTFLGCSGSVVFGFWVVILCQYLIFSDRLWVGSNFAKISGGLAKI